MSDKTKGIYNKFSITRTDGQSEPGQKHDNCNYFVLDLDHDPFAIPAIQAYAAACKDQYPELSKDLTRIGFNSIGVHSSKERKPLGDENGHR